jgi:hypothetical protein
MREPDGNKGIEFRSLPCTEGELPLIAKVAYGLGFNSIFCLSEFVSAVRIAAYSTAVGGPGIANHKACLGMIKLEAET